MDAPKDTSSSSKHQNTKPLPQLQAGRTSSSSIEGNIRGAGSMAHTLRREHSDGDVLSDRPRLRHQTLGSEILRGEETWIDFLRDSNAGSLSEQQARIATRRAAMVAVDRKRRLSEQPEHFSRRRSANNVSIEQLSSGRMRSLARTVDPYPATPRRFDHRSGQRITDRPLPPPPGAASSHGRLSRDIKIPTWQPDTEVSDCPICGHRFNFWYRKHHCRKCGRVVCASCSPHRITIPRQFIVNPPLLGSDQSLGAGTTPGSTVIDLAGDDEVEATGLQDSLSANRWQNQENGIDSALGGGQEVRLCNPCVPDPNPSPHLPFAPPRHYGSFSTLEGPARLHQEQTYSDPNDQQQLSLSRGTGSNHPLRHPRNAAVTDVNPERQPTSSPFTAASTSTHPQSHTSRNRDGFPNYPPNYSLIYGSAPDPSFHEVRLKSFEIAT